MDIAVEQMRDTDWPAVERIYREGIATGNATFAAAPPDWRGWDDGHLKSCRLIVRTAEEILGWAALSPVSGRCVYAGVAEVSVYVGERARGMGVGRRLLEALTKESERHNLWTLQAGIFPENIASIAVHKGCGFREVGRREKLGKMNDRWRDVLLLERRSEIVGR